jgi:hypothetical protein
VRLSKGGKEVRLYESEEASFHETNRMFRLRPLEEGILRVSVPSKLRGMANTLQIRIMELYPFGGLGPTAKRRLVPMPLQNKKFGELGAHRIQFVAKGQSVH